MIRPMGYEQDAGSFVVVVDGFFVVFDGFLVTGAFVVTVVMVVVVSAFFFVVDMSFVAAIVCFFIGGFTANIATLSQFMRRNNYKQV